MKRAARLACTLVLSPAVAAGLALPLVALPLTGCALATEAGSSAGCDHPAAVELVATVEPEGPLLPAGSRDGPSADLASSASVLVAYFTRWDSGAAAGTDAGIDTSTSASVVSAGESQLGTTACIALLIQRQTGADLLSIRTADPYPAAFDDVVDQNHDEQAADVRPALEQASLDPGDYDVVFLGFPVWSSDVPQAILSFLAESDLAGATVIPFCTHDGYGAGCSFATVAEACPGATVLDGLAVAATDVAAGTADVLTWLNGLDLPRGPVTSDLAALHGIEGRVDATFSLGDAR